MMKRISLWPILTGAAVGLAALLLSHFGNPANMGFCVACFLRDTAGCLGLHSAAAVRYFRPEIVGLLSGAMVMALVRREFKSKGGSAPMIRFLLGMLVMCGALMFLGCPLRMVLRLGGGDWNALVGLVGFVTGILVGVCFLNRGFTMNRAYRQTRLEGGVVPIGLMVLFVLSLLAPGLFPQSIEGPGSQAAPWLLALPVSMLVGALCQKSRFCMSGGIRDAVMFRDFHLLSGAGALFVTVLLGNLALRQFHPGFAGQPVAHTDSLWNFLGMVVVGWGSVLLGGCPLRQLILAGEGDSDAGTAVLGMVFGASLCHNLGLASTVNGPTHPGKLAVAFAMAVMLLLSVVNAREGKR